MRSYSFGFVDCSFSLITLPFVDFANEPTLDGMVQIKSKNSFTRGDGPLIDNPYKCSLSQTRTHLLQSDFSLFIWTKPT